MFLGGASCQMVDVLAGLCTTPRLISHTRWGGMGSCSPTESPMVTASVLAQRMAGRKEVPERGQASRVGKAWGIRSIGRDDFTA